MKLRYISGNVMAEDGNRFRETSIVSASAGFKLFVGETRKGSAPKVTIDFPERAEASPCFLSFLNFKAYNGSNTNA